MPLKKNIDKSELSPQSRDIKAKEKPTSGNPSGKGPVKFTSSETIDEMVYPDDTVEILAYVDAVQAPRIVGTKGNFKLFKFVLNNNAGRRIQCLAWQDQVERVASEVKMNKIIHLNGAVSKEILKPLYNTGNVPFELSIQNQTTVDGKRGYFEVNCEAETPSTIVEWSELSNMEGRLIEVSGWLKMGFKMTNHKSGESAYGVGAITDGKLKLAIRVASFDDVPSGLKIGSGIRAVGVMHFEKIPYLQVPNGLSIKLDEKSPMDSDRMHDITGTPKKKARTE